MLENLDCNVKILFKGFKINSMRANREKFQFIIVNKSIRQSVSLHINDVKVISLGLTTIS